MLAQPQQPQAFEVSKPEQLTPQMSLGLNPGLERAGLSAAPGIKLRSQILDSRLQAAQLEPGFFRYAKLLQGVLWGVEGLQCDPQPRSPPPHTPHPSPTLPVIF